MIVPHYKLVKPPLLVWILLQFTQSSTIGYTNVTGIFQSLACKLTGYWFLETSADTALDFLFSATDECYLKLFQTLVTWKRASAIIFSSLSQYSTTSMHTITTRNNCLAVRNPCLNMLTGHTLNYTYKNGKLYHFQKIISYISLKQQTTSIPLSAHLVHL